MKFSSRMNSLQDEALLNAFENIENKDMISFSAGFPSQETYPVEDIKKALADVMANNGYDALSYCSTSGYSDLRKIISKRLKEEFGLGYGIDEIIITNGSQQGLDMSAMLFLNRGDIVLCEMPTYMGTVNALKVYEAQLEPVPLDEDGIDLDILKEKIKRFRDRIKMIVVCPDNQNPTGITWSVKRRKDFVRVVSEENFPVIEDAAYSELTYVEKSLPPLASFDDKGQIVYLGTLSKVFCSGLRIAWMCAKKKLISKFLLLKNTMDLSSCTLAQYAAADYLITKNISTHINSVKAIYQHRRDTMLDAIKKEIPDEVQYYTPKGGLYIWLKLPCDMDAVELLKEAKKNGVSFIPGTSFYPDNRKSNELRLNFSNMDDVSTVKGIRILADTIRGSLIKRRKKYE